ncbi:MAG: excinuclease ABC subunit UvrA [Tissierellia bacterium]|nr:excinuclease ABC subunit UvrA [Tissierellia bacterium]
MSLDKIIIKGARENNLKSVDLEIDRDQLIVFTGLSGSGKSSLAFDTIYAEGQRRYVESLSSYARQFLGQMDKPDVEYIEGLSPSISIDQKTTSKNPRSTVGTVTEIYDYLRLLFAKVGTPYCPTCGKEIKSQSIDQMVDIIVRLPERSRLKILSPIIRGKKGEHVRLIENIKKEGYNRIIADGEEYDLFDDIKLEKNKKHDIDVVVDRIIVKEGIESRLSDSLETALKLSDGIVKVENIGVETMTFSQKMACPDGHMQIEEIEPRSFSFNSPYGMCSECNGLGFHLEIDPELIIPNYELSLNEGAIDPFSTSKPGSYYYEVFKAIADKFNFSMDNAIKNAPIEMIDEILYGTKSRNIRFRFDSHYSGSKVYSGKWEGVIPNLDRRYRQTGSEYMKEKIDEYMIEKTCSSCKGKRLRAEVLSIKIGGMDISEVTEMAISKAYQWFIELELDETKMAIGRLVLKEIRERLKFLNEVGLGYLTMARSAGSLSGGESQRIRLATQIGSSLIGVIYVLDEPSIGLHQRDNEMLLKSLRGLTDIGNTLIVVEHDEDTMRMADCIVDIGPGAGVHGGEIVFKGTYNEILEADESITGQYLSGKKYIPIPKEHRKPNGYIEIKGARENNLKNIDVKIPLSVFTCITGVSGSGKSSLINSILHKGLSRKLYKSKVRPGEHDSIEGIEQLDKVVEINQSPIGRTPRSNPATYTKVFDHIRDIFAMTTDAKMRGYKKGRFSFNVKGGRCETCKGDGTIKVEMHFLPDVYVPCEVCKGKRYNRETLEVKYKGKNISDVLNMTIEEAAKFFENIPSIAKKLNTLLDVGLGYLKLGQSSTQLSGGEAQRVKLASELSKRATGKTIYILDEPTTGLHTADIHKLIKVLDRLADGGNTVVVIEHNLDVIKTADHIIDLGPEGGDKGGQIVCTGTPQEIAENESSHTGRFLKAEFKRAEEIMKKINSKSQAS